MSRVTAARRVAWQLLGVVRRKQAYARDVLRESDALDGLDACDRAFATRLVLGVVATCGYVDAAVDHKALRPGRIEPTVRDALRLACYELLFMETPARAAVSQGVELARIASPRAAGMANAVLRRVAQTDVPLREAAVERLRGGGMEAEDLALVSGYPAWLLRAVAEDRSDEAARTMALCACDAPPTYVAANLAKMDEREAFAQLAAGGLEPGEEALPGAFALAAPAGITRSPIVASCAVVVADLSAQRVAELAVPESGGRLLEVGQGRGTKSILMQNVASRRGVTLSIVGIDDEPYKVRVAARRMKVAGLSDVVRCVSFDACALGTGQADSAGLVGDKRSDSAVPAPTSGRAQTAGAAGPDLPEELAGPFDAVFVDAPCSGTGTLRRHPEICWNLTAEDVASLAALQLRMLRAVSTRVRAGGMLTYATCSILRAEDEAVVHAFLASPEGAHFAPLGEPFLSLPASGGPDGHFCARFVRCKNCTNEFSAN